MIFPGNIIDLLKRIKICLYMGYPMWALEEENSELQNPIEYVVSKFFSNLVPYIKSQDSSLFADGVYGEIIKTQLITTINDVAKLTGSPKTGSIQVDEVFKALIYGDWNSVGGDNELAGGEPSYNLRVKVVSLIALYTDSVLQEIQNFYFEDDETKIEIPFVLDYPYPYGYGYGYIIGGDYGYGYGYEGLPQYFDIIEG